MTKLERMIIHTDPNDWHGMTSEKIWVKKMDEETFRVENNILYAYGISFGDIVSGTRKDNALEFFQVIKKGGHSNYRILLKRNISPDEFRRRFSTLEKMGCRYESSHDPEDVFAIDVPPDTNVNSVYKILDDGVVQGLWHLDEGNFEH